MSSMIFILYPSMIVKDTQRHSFLCEWIGIFEKIEYLCNALAFRVGHERNVALLVLTGNDRAARTE